MRPHRSETDCSPTFHPNRVFLGVTVALSALSAGVLYLGSQIVSPSGLRQLTPDDAERLYRIVVTPEPSPAESPPWLEKAAPDPKLSRRISHRRQVPQLHIQKYLTRSVQLPMAVRNTGILHVLRQSAHGAALAGGGLNALRTDAGDALGSGSIGASSSAYSGSGVRAALSAPSQPGPDTSRYQPRTDHGITAVAQQPVSTFSMDVDTGSYSNVRGYIDRGTLPPADAVRVEEMINYFPYAYAPPTGDAPFAVSTETARCPWNADHLLLRIGVKSREEAKQDMPPANLVFLVDVSGSMQTEDKLPLLQESLRTLVRNLRPQDRVSLVTYAGDERIALQPTSGSERVKILSAIAGLSAGGSTAGEAGIRTAYALARRNLIKGGVNRVILATDGDFNVGVSDTEQLKSIIAEQRKSGVYLSTLGFGSDNYNEALMEQIADVGNGNYSYIDSLKEGRKVLHDQLQATLHTVAKDVKVQVEFQPAQIREYRLLGYENRMLARQDFKNDAVDAGEIGAGASVTALYELTPFGSPSSVEPLRYQPPPSADQPGSPPAAHAGELAFVRVRYQPPEGGASRELAQAVPAPPNATPFARASDDFRFAAAVAGFGQILRGGRHTQAFGLPQVVAIADAAR
ncbi:MAG TPA: VWA domain-containing protein, partial [Pseudomonadota bacterium]|nr:VWA domain-containing protein [Pseudomonadota bacterium]